MCNIYDDDRSHNDMMLHDVSVRFLCQKQLLLKVLEHVTSGYAFVLGRMTRKIQNLLCTKQSCSAHLVSTMALDKTFQTRLS